MRTQEMSDDTWREILTDLIMQLRIHPHKDEIISLMLEQVSEDSDTI